MANWIGVVAPAVIGVAFVLVGVPLAGRRVARNGLYGFRIGATLRDGDVWYAVNERAGRHLIVLGGSLIAVAVIGVLFTDNEETQRDLLILGLAIAVSGLGFSVRTCYLLARNLERARRLSAE